MLIDIKMPTIVGILAFMSWISFLLSWVEYEKSFITLGPSPICLQKTFAHIYIYDDKAYKNLCAGPNYEYIYSHFPIVSYQPI